MDLQNETFKRLIDTFLFYRKPLLIFFVFLATFSLIYSFSIPKKYLSTAVMMESESKQNPSSPLGGGGLNSLASLAGINLPSVFQNQGRLNEVSETIKSRKFILNLINKYELQKDLLAAKSWNAKNGLKYKSSWLRGEKYKNASNETLFRSFSSNLIVDIDRETDFLTIGFIHFSPAFSKSVIDLISQEINNYIRGNDLNKAQRSLDYLQENVTGISNAELKQVFFYLIKDETRVLMLANSIDEYVVKTIDPAFTPELKYSPRRSILILTIVAIGWSIFFIVLYLALFFGYKMNFSFSSKPIIFSKNLININE